ncbi:ATP synthase F1 subunit epsilon [Patescibacteria group bacterium]|nr:ATP synthase F1 subunit epsilon [Patescibacteria group bacterium]
MKFKIVTPERVVYEDEVDQITLPTTSGEITVLPNHIPLVSSLNAGEVLIKKEKEEIPMVISGGFVEISSNNLTILADTAERVEEIDEARAEAARKKAEELLSRKEQIATEAVDYTALAVKMEKELARLKIVRKYRKFRNPPQMNKE